MKKNHQIAAAIPGILPQNPLIRSMFSASCAHFALKVGATGQVYEQDKNFACRPLDQPPSMSCKGPVATVSVMI